LATLFSVPCPIQIGFQASLFIKNSLPYRAAIAFDLTYVRPEQTKGVSNLKWNYK